MQNITEAGGETIPAGLSSLRDIFYGMDGKPISVEEYPGSVTVRYTNLGQRGRVSTILLGIDMNYSRSGPPVIFETMIFGGPANGAAGRYATLAGARAGHMHMVRILRQLSKPKQLLHKGKKP